MSPELEFRWANPDDLPAYEAFVRDRFGPDSVQALPGRARWLYWDNPFGLHVALCHHQDRIVGACGHLPLPIRIGGVATLAGFGIDMMVDPAWRRRGIGRRFLELRLQRFHVSLSSGQSQEMAALYRREGAHDLGAFHLARWRRLLPGPRAPKAWLRELIAWLLPQLRRAPGACKRQPLTVAEAADLLAANPPGNSGPRQEDLLATWFRWRYDGPVYRDYRCWTLQAADLPPAILVTRADGRYERLVDVVAPRSQLPRLLQAAARTSNAPLVTALVAGQPLVTGLAKMGFLSRPQDSRLVALTPLTMAVDPSRLVFLAGISDADLIRRPAVAVTPGA